MARAHESWGYAPIFIEDGKNGMIAACQEGYQRCDSDIVAHFHDDLIIHDPDWVEKVLHEFDDPKVGIVGLGGSKVWGDRGIYRKPYQIMQLSRGLYLSNMTDAEVHGVRYTVAPTDVAVLDGFALIMRREFMQKSGGWPVGKLVFHGYDFFWCAMAHKLGYKIRLVPISCTHLGGQTSVIQHMDDGTSHAKGHEWIYELCRGILPVSVE